MTTTTKKMIEEVKRDLVEPDPNQPRKYFDDAKLIELGTDIAINGILQAVVVRPHPTSKGRYMIIFGERRWRAAGPGYAELETVPVVVYADVNDAQALEWQMAENGKRDDMHPLEEADGYRVMHERDGRDVEEIAEITGKSKAYVYAAMKLCALKGDARSAFLAGTIDKSVALLIARLPVELQPQAAKKIVHGWNGEAWSYRQARDYIQREYILELGRAPFNINDATLVVAAGVCGECPKRTGNQQDLFADVCSEKGGNERCTDPACFKAKTDAHWKRTKEQFKAAGKEVLEGEEGNRAGSYNDKKYVELGGYCSDAGKTYKELLGRRADEAVSAIAKTDTGAVRELVDRKRLPELLKAAGVKAPRSVTGPTPKEKEKRKEAKRDEAKRDEALEAAVVARVHAEVLDRASAAPAAESLEMWRLLARMAIRDKGGYGVSPLLDLALARRGVKNEGAEEDASSDVMLMHQVDKMTTPAELRGLVFELLVGHVRGDVYTLEAHEKDPKKTDPDYFDWLAQDQTNLRDAIAVLGVNVKALTKEATQVFEAAEKEKAAAKAPKAKARKLQPGEIEVAHKPKCEVADFVFTDAVDAAGINFRPRKGGPTSTGAGYVTDRICPECDAPVPATPATAAAVAKAAKKRPTATPHANGVAPAAEATS